MSHSLVAFILTIMLIIAYVAVYIITSQIKEENKIEPI